MAVTLSSPYTAAAAASNGEEGEWSSVVKATKGGRGREREESISYFVGIARNLILAHLGDLQLLKKRRSSMIHSTWPTLLLWIGPPPQGLDRR